MNRRILVINPNSNEAFTAAMDRSVERLRFVDGPEIHCRTLAEGPFGIETARQSQELIPCLYRLIEREKDNYDAFIIACFSDPGVVGAREFSAKAVIGLCEAGVASALSFGERYGILTNLDDDINGELRLLRTLGLEARLAGIEAVGIKVPDLVDTPEVFEALLAGARRLEQRGARVIVLGCAGMTPFARRLRQETGLWIIDPLMSAVGLATATV